MARPKTPLAAWIRDQRGVAGWKSEELARRLGVSESTVRGWESGRAVGWDKLEAMERLFGATAPGKERGEATGDLASALHDVADAIRQQGLLLAALADIQGQQSVQVHRNSDRIDALAAVLGRLIERDAEASVAPELRRATKE